MYNMVSAVIAIYLISKAHAASPVNCATESKYNNFILAPFDASNYKQAKKGVVSNFRNIFGSQFPYDDFNSALSHISQVKIEDLFRERLNRLPIHSAESLKIKDADLYDILEKNTETIKQNLHRYTQLDTKELQPFKDQLVKFFVDFFDPLDYQLSAYKKESRDYYDELLSRYTDRKNVSDIVEKIEKYYKVHESYRDITITLIMNAEKEARNMRAETSCLDHIKTFKSDYSSLFERILKDKINEYNDAKNGVSDVKAAIKLILTDIFNIMHMMDLSRNTLGFEGHMHNLVFKSILEMRGNLGKDEFIDILSLAFEIYRKEIQTETRDSIVDILFTVVFNGKVAETRKSNRVRILATKCSNMQVPDAIAQFKNSTVDADKLFYADVIYNMKYYGLDIKTDKFDIIFNQWTLLLDLDLERFDLLVKLDKYLDNKLVGMDNFFVSLYNTFLISLIRHDLKKDAKIPDIANSLIEESRLRKDDLAFYRSYIYKYYMYYKLVLLYAEVEHFRGTKFEFENYGEDINIDNDIESRRFDWLNEFVLSNRKRTETNPSDSANELKGVEVSTNGFDYLMSHKFKRDVIRI